VTVQCENTMDDILAFNVYHYRHSPGARREMLLCRYGFPVLMLLGVMALTDFTGLPPWLMALSVWPLVAWVVLLPIFFRWYLKIACRRFLREGRNNHMVGERTLELRPDSIVEITEVGESKTKWTGVERIVKTDDFVFVYNSAVTAYVAPKRAFETEEMFDPFFETANRLKAKFSG
jgi:hypothetical protein